MAAVQLLFGPLLIGAFVNSILYGVLLVQVGTIPAQFYFRIPFYQVLIYYRAYKKDRLRMRLFVLFLFLMETLNTAFDMLIMYEPLVQKYGTMDATTFFPLFLPTDPLLTVIISTPIQMFIAYRIKIISRQTWLAAAICALALASFGGGVWLTATVVHIRRYSRKPELHWPALLWLLSSAVVDVSITISLSINLVRRKTGFSKTDDTINRIVRWTIQTGFITAVFATLDVICFLVLPHTTINFVWDFSLSKLYSNVLLSTLNARSAWRKIADRSGHNVLFGIEGPVQQIELCSGSTNSHRPQIVATGTYAAGTTKPNKSSLLVSMTKEVASISDRAVDSHCLPV